MAAGSICIRVMRGAAPMRVFQLSKTVEVEPVAGFRVDPVRENGTLAAARAVDGGRADVLDAVVVCAHEGGREDEQASCEGVH